MRLFVDHLMVSGEPEHRPVFLVLAPLLSPALLSSSGSQKPVSIGKRAEFRSEPSALRGRLNLACGGR